MALTKVTGQVIKSDTNVTVGVITATKFVGPIETTGDVSAVDGTFTGSVSIAGTLTYADVTNVDSLGIVTARHGFRATAGGINVTAGISTFGGNIDANGTLDVDGDTQLDDLNVAGVATFSSGITANSTLYVGSDLTITDKIVHNGDTNTALRFPTADTITAETGGSERLRIDSGGRLFTGGSTQVLDATAGTLHISGGTSGGRIAIRGTTTSADAGLAEIFAFWDTNKVAGIIAKSGTDTTNKDDGKLLFYTADGSGVVERLRITSAGNLLIGKTVDSGKPLEVYQAGDAAIRIQNNASGTGTGDGLLFEIGSSTKDALIWNYESANMRFGTAGTERLRIDSSGRLLLGLTSSIGGNAIFQVQGSGNRKAHFHQPDTGSCIVQFTNTTTGTSTSDGATIGLDGDESFLISQKENNHIAIHTNNTERLRIGSAGQFGIGGANYGSSGQVLTSQGSGAAVQWAAAGGGWTVHKDATTAFGNNLIEQTSGLSASTDVIQIVAYRLRCANGSGTRQCVQLGTSGGYGGTYNDIQRYWVNVGSQETNRGHDQSMWSAWHGLSNPFSNTNLEFSGTITITRMGGNNFVMESQCIADRADNNNQYQILNSGRLELGGALTKIKIYTESGNNFSSGNVTIRSM